MSSTEALKTNTRTDLKMCVIFGLMGVMGGVCLGWSIHGTQTENIIRAVSATPAATGTVGGTTAPVVPQVSTIQTAPAAATGTVAPEK